MELWMDQLTPEERVLSAGDQAQAVYGRRLLHSTEYQHGELLEAALLAACRRYRRLHRARMRYLRQGGVDAHLRRSSLWVAASEGFMGALDVLAVAFGARFPPPGDRRDIPPYNEVRALVAYRVGPLCCDPYCPDWDNDPDPGSVHTHHEGPTI